MITKTNTFVIHENLLTEEMKKTFEILKSIVTKTTVIAMMDDHVFAFDEADGRTPDEFLESFRERIKKGFLNPDFSVHEFDDGSAMVGFGEGYLYTYVYPEEVRETNSRLEIGLTYRVPAMEVILNNKDVVVMHIPE